MASPCDMASAHLLFAAAPQVLVKATDAVKDAP
jgi:hypothetical protein